MNNKIELEKNEIDDLLDAGVSFKVGKKSYIITKPYLGTLDMLSRLFIEMEIDQDALEKNPTTELNHISKVSAFLMAKVVAIAVLNSKWRIKILSPLLARALYWKLTPSDLLGIVQIILSSRDLQSFITSIRLTAGARTTKPNLVEENKQA